MLAAILVAAAWRSIAALAPPPAPASVNPPVVQSASGEYVIEDGMVSGSSGLAEASGGDWSLAGGLGRTFTGQATPRPNAADDWSGYE